MGDDPMRAALNFGRARSMQSQSVSEYWRKRWNILYDYKIK
jgi:hypothetical protein